MGSLWENLIVEAYDPGRLARWWAEALDYRVIEETPDGVEIRCAEARPGLLFVPIEPGPEEGDGPGRGRLHLDLRPADREAEVERLVDMGARHVNDGFAAGAGWTMLADPEGNEFRVFSPAVRP